VDTSVHSCVAYCVHAATIIGVFCNSAEALLPQESMAPVGLLRRVGHKAREEASHLIATRKTAHLGEPWHRNWEVDSTHSKVTSGRASGCMGRLFNLVREKKFEEMLAYLDQLGRSQDSLIQQELDVYLYARLMTVCTRDLGPECALPIFELMLQQGEVVPNVVHYTIVIRSLMDLAAHEGNGSTIPGHKGLSEQTSHKSWSSKAIELLKEMRVKGIVPNELTYKPIMAWLPSKGRVVEFEELKKLMEVDEVPFVGVFKYYEIRLALRVADFDKAKTLFIAAKRENKNIASSLNCEHYSFSLRAIHHSFSFHCYVSMMEPSFCGQVPIWSSVLMTKQRIYELLIMPQDFVYLS